jgi:hypothetical protein
MLRRSCLQHPPCPFPAFAVSEDAAVLPGQSQRRQYHLHNLRPWDHRRCHCHRHHACSQRRHQAGHRHCSAHDSVVLYYRFPPPRDSPLDLSISPSFVRAPSRSHGGPASSASAIRRRPLSVSYWLALRGALGGGLFR